MTHPSITPLSMMENIIETMVDDQQYDELLQEGEKIAEATSPKQPPQELRVQLVSLDPTTAAVERRREQAKT